TVVLRFFSPSSPFTRTKKRTSNPMINVREATVKNIPFLDQSINRAKIGGPMATPIKRTELYKDVTNPLRSFPTDPVIKLFTHGKTRPAPTLLIPRTSKNGNSFLKNMSPPYEI